MLALLVGLFAGLFAVILYYDYRQYRIPNILVFPGMAFALFVAALTGHFFVSLLGGLVVLVTLVGVMLITKTMVGMGDIKLGMLIGFVLGFPLGLWTVLYSVIAGGVICFVLLKLGVVKTSTKLPMALFLSSGAVIAMFTEQFAGMFG